MWKLNIKQFLKKNQCPKTLYRHGCIESKENPLINTLYLLNMNLIKNLYLLKISDMNIQAKVKFDKKA